MDSELEALYSRLAAKAMSRADLPPEKPSAATRFVRKRYKRLAPAQKTHCIRGHERTDENLDAGAGCYLCRKERAIERNKGARLSDKVTHRPTRP